MNSFAWDKFRKQQAAERERRLAGMHPLLAKCRDTAPTEIELSALAAMLHSFYTGVENIFKRASIELDGQLLHGDAWHRDLLREMSVAKASRPALLSTGLHDQLLEYLRFRHVFRNAYSFDLDWQKMAHLVLGVESVLRDVETALDRFSAKQDASMKNNPDVT